MKPGTSIAEKHNDCAFCASRHAGREVVALSSEKLIVPAHLEGCVVASSKALAGRLEHLADGGASTCV